MNHILGGQAENSKLNLMMKKKVQEGESDKCQYIHISIML